MFILGLVLFFVGGLVAGWVFPQPAWANFLVSKIKGLLGSK